MRRALALAIIALFSASMTAVAFAHAAYESSDPDNGSTVSSPPSRVIADFTERLESSNSSLSVIDPCGTQVDRGDSLVANDRITVSMSANKQGTYVVNFQALSAVDGHVTRGRFSFTSTGGEACPQGASEEEEEPEPERESERAPRGEDDPDPDRGEDATSQTTSESGRQRGDARPSGSGDRDDDGARTVKGAPQGNQELAGPVVQDLDLGTDRTSIWDGIPIGDFLVALAVAALIGAAGGRIYAGIVGPRR